MRDWRGRVFAGLKLRQPRVNFLTGDVQAGRLVLLPRGHHVAIQLLAILLVVDILLDRFEPRSSGDFWRASASRCRRSLKASSSCRLGF
jgi:hypothetical protein